MAVMIHRIKWSSLHSATPFYETEIAAPPRFGLLTSCLYSFFVPLELVAHKMMLVTL